MRQRIAVFLALGMIGACDVRAADLSGQLGIGAIYSDNIRLTAADTQGDTIGVMSTDFLVHEETRRFVGDVAADLQYLTFEHKVYSNELLGDLTGFGKFAIVPGELDWVLQDNFGQQQLTPGTPPTPQNLENINYVSTGPEFSVPLDAQLHALLSARYSRVSYQLNDANNNRGDASAALVHPLSANSNASVNVSAERVSYDDSVNNPDFTTRLGYLHYDAQGARSKLTADAGYNDVLVEGERSGGLLVRADATRTLSASSVLELAAGRGISDTSNLLRQMQGTNNVTLGAAALQRSQDPFTSRYARATWRFDRHRTGFALALSQFRETHTVQADLNRTRTEVNASARRTLAENLVFSLGAGYARDSYVNSITPNDTYVRGTADLAWRIGRRVEVRFQYSHIDQRSDAIINTYKENRFLLTAGVATENWAGFAAGIPYSSPTGLQP
jgi:putative beta-barrel porin BBP2